MSPTEPTETDWPVIESQTEYETGWYDGGYDLVTQPDGSEKRYYWAALPDAVVVVARVDGVTVAEGNLDFGSESESESESEDSRHDDRPADRLLFVEQYRPAIRETHLELPAGIVEDGESYSQAAARELEEETGFAPSSTVVLQEYAVATGVLRHNRAVVYADGLELGEPDLDSNEFLEVRSVPVTEALDRAREEPANDSTISALLLAEQDGLLTPR